MSVEWVYNIIQESASSFIQWVFSISQKQIIDYTPIFALIITISIFTYSQHQKKRIESAQLCLDLNKRLFESSIKKTRTTIYNATDLKKDLVIVPKDQTYTGTDDIAVTERELDDYLNVLEEIGLFVNKKILNKDFAYEMFSFQFRSIHDNKVIHKYMNDQRIIQKQDDIWSQFEIAYTGVMKLSIKQKMKFYKKNKKNTEKNQKDQHISN